MLREVGEGEPKCVKDKHQFLFECRRRKILVRVTAGDNNDNVSNMYRYLKLLAFIWTNKYIGKSNLNI
jgi:hypothetical protein